MIHTYHGLMRDQEAEVISSSATHPRTQQSRPSQIPPTPINGSVLVLSSITRNVLSSATKAKLGALFHNVKEAEAIRAVLRDLGHPQPPTPLQTDNKGAACIANYCIKQKRSKAVDMRYYWVRDCVFQGHFTWPW